jgi:lysozyme
MAREMIKEHEGKRLDVYKDSRGKKTVGYGHLIDEDSPEDIRNLKVGEEISAERAEQLFNQDYAYHARAAKEIPGFSRASESQKEALIDLTFNMGPNWYKNFPKFAEAFEAGNYEQAAKELKNSDWYDQVGRRAPAIVSMVKEAGATQKTTEKPAKPKGKVDFDRIVVGPDAQVAKTKPKIDYKNLIVIPDSAKESLQELDQLEQERAMGLAVEIGEGITLGLLGELAAVAEAASSDRSYQEAKDNYELARKKFKRENPSLATYAVPLELAATIPTGIGLAKGLGKLGVKSAAGQLGIEGAGYGLATGETFEQRVTGAGIGALTGLTLGRVIDVATSPSKAGGLKTDKDFEADKALDPDDLAEANSIQQADAQRFFDEVDNPAYRRKPLSEAETVGELWSGLKTSAQNFYNQNLRGVSDTIWAEVSPQVGALVQRFDTKALLTINKEFSDLSEQLIPVAKTINESEHAKGALLDYAAGKMIDPDQIRLLREERKRLRASGLKGSKEAKKMEDNIRSSSTERLMSELSQDLTAEQKVILKRYLAYSYAKNQKLNKKTFGADFSDDLTFLHTRLTKEQIKKLKEERKLTDEQIEGLFDDPAFKQRTRGSYLRGDENAPKPANYDNPLISDIQRIQRLEQLSQMQDAFKLNIAAAVQRNGGRPLTPNQLMDELEFKLFERGISPEGSKYTRKQISEMIMGQEKAPHPLIQALNSIAYATTLAGPMSAILNLADIPLLGAKYGGKAVREGIKEADPRMLTPFKKPSDLDLKQMGLNNQVFGEFVSQLNELQSGGTNWMMKTAKAARQSADFLMRKSGFAAMDVVGKKGVMRGILTSAADDAKAGRLADNWGFYFNDAELDIIAKQLKAHGTEYSKYTGKGKDLVEELMFAGLGQQQLISAAGRPAGWARNPNLRPLWALRGFVIKQQALALREVVGNIKAGKPDKAAEFMGRYALYGAGGYAVINEGRQFIFGDGNVSAGGLARGYGDAWASLLTANTLGLNDYQYGQIQQNGLLYTFAEGMMPLAPSRAADIVGTAIEVIDQERPPQAFVTEVSPLIKQSLRFGRNVAQKTGATEAESMFAEGLRRRNTED